MLKGAVHSVESFGSVDGPGIRFVIFLNGCQMRCRYCHNPDTWTSQSEDMRTTDELLAQALRFRTYWGRKGGITVSGGEPLLQIDFLTELFRKAKDLGIHTAVDTSAQPFSREEPFFSKFCELMRFTDLVLLDLKHIDDVAHKRLTGKSNTNILDCASYLSEIGKPMWVRHVLVPTITDDDDALQRLHDFMATLRNVEKVEVLPYHTLSLFKWQKLGIPFTLDGIKPPTEERVANAQRILGAQS